MHEITSISLFTIYDYIKKLKNDISLKDLLWSRRPKKLFPRKYHHLGKLISKNKFSICVELANSLNKKYSNLNIFKKSILREFHNLQYICKILKSISLLIDLYKQCCVKFAMKY